MPIAQVTTSYSLSDIIGGFQITLLLFSLVYSLALCVLAIKRASLKTLVTPPILALSINAWIIGTLFFRSGSQKYWMSIENAAMDPSVYLMDTGVFHSSVGASLLLLSVTGGLVSLSFLIICWRTRRPTSEQDIAPNP